MTLYRIRILLFITFISLITSVACYAQSSTISPYSRYGIGDLQNQYGAQSFSMGQTGIALHNDSLAPPYFINLKNPASYFYNRITTIEAGILNQNTQLNTEGLTHKNSNSYFGYFAIAFPVGKHFGVCMGLRPMSSVGYSINTASTIDSAGHPLTGSGGSVDSVDNQYVASGGINQLHLGLAYSPFKNLSVGVNASYLFGNIITTDNVIYPLNMAAYNSQRTENVNVHGFTFDYGAMYTLGKTRDSVWQVVLGATASLGGSVNAGYNLLSISYVAATPQTNIDTIQDSNSGGKLKLPIAFGGGISVIKRGIYGDMWTFTFDYSVQNWSQYTYFGQPQSSLTNSSQMGFGVQFVPNKNGFNSHKQSYFSRAFYRFGIDYEQTYLDINNTPLKNYCLSLGIGLPIGPPYVPGLFNQIGTLNLGIQVGQLGTTSDNLLREDYLKFMIAFTFNSLWFQKRLYQ